MLCRFVARKPLCLGRLEPTLRSEGILSGGKVDYVSDVNAAFGGPLQRDRLWFFGPTAIFVPTNT